MSTENDDPLIAELRALPGAALSPPARVRALAAAEQALARSTAPRAWWWRWLSADTLVPAVLCLGGLLYAAGAMREIARVYGRGPGAVAARGAPHPGPPGPLPGRGDEGRTLTSAWRGGEAGRILTSAARREGGRRYSLGGGGLMGGSALRTPLVLVLRR
jgi:hypothetical protein